ncbi:MAG: hypothetical protein J0651_00935, partial [Actinobacteria bacterium]|nr:hypothetical protein [Actinomycetota bacterium]
ITSIEKTYETHRHENETWEVNWYNNTLSEVVRLNQEAARHLPLEKFWRKKSLQAASVYILGPAQRVDDFRDVELGVVKSLREPLPRFPASQADGAGHMYLRRQTYLCPFGLPKRWRRCRKEGPEPVAKFPVVKWEAKGQILKATPKCDVLYSTDSVESTISRLLRWSLDNLGAERQDFFVPQLLRPNTCFRQSSPGFTFASASTGNA